MCSMILIVDRGKLVLPMDLAHVLLLIHVHLFDVRQITVLTLVTRLRTHFVLFAAEP